VIEHDVLTEECITRRALGASVDELVAWLRGYGCSKIECMYILVRSLGLQLEEAKRIVHFSPVWEDRRASDDELHDALENFITNDPASRGMSDRSESVRPANNRRA
jgi:hypothetical protein